MNRISRIVAFVLVLSGTMSAQSAPTLFADRNWSAGVGRVEDIAYSPDGRLLAVVGGNGGIAVWDVQSGSPVRQVTMSREATTRVAFGGPGTVAAGNERGLVSTLSLLTGQIREVARHDRKVTAIALSADGLTGASGDEKGNIILWPAEGGQPAPLREDRGDKPIVFLSFTDPTTLLSLNEDLDIITWDVPKRRSTRRGTLQVQVAGRSAEFKSAATDAKGSQLVLGSQLLARRAGGVLTQGGLIGDTRRPQTPTDRPVDRIKVPGAVASPTDLGRGNVIVPYSVQNGLAGDPIASGDYVAEHISLTPDGCWAIFSSNYRDQARLHVWSLIKQGQDVARIELPARPTALALDGPARTVALAFQNGEVRTWRTSGTTAPDCVSFKQAVAGPSPGDKKPEPRYVLGPETAPIFTERSNTRVAVLPFEVGGVEAYIGDSVAEMISGEIANSNTVVVIERAAINAILKEMKLQASGLTAADAAKIGKGLNAQKVVVGGVRRFGEGSYYIGARFVDTETQQSHGSREVTCENCTEANLPAAVRTLRRTIVP